MLAAQPPSGREVSCGKGGSVLEQFPLCLGSEASIVPGRGCRERAWNSPGRARLIRSWRKGRFGSMAEGLVKRPGGQTGDNNVGRGSTEQPGAGWWPWQWMCRRRALGRTIWGQVSSPGLHLTFLLQPPQEPRTPALRRPSRWSRPRFLEPPALTPIALIRGAKTSQVLPGNGLIST